MKIKFIILFLIIFFIYVILSNTFRIFPLENLDVNPTNSGSGGMGDYSSIDASIESNNLIQNSPNERRNRQYVIDRENGVFTENEYDLLVRARHEEKPTEIVKTKPQVHVQDNNHNNLNFNNNLTNWDITYFPESIIGPNGIGLMPSISIKNGKDSYGFTFPKNYLQLQFAGYDQYNFNQKPFITVQTSVPLNPGSYSLKYNIQTRPGISWDIDQRTIGIMPMVNNTSGPIFLFYKLDSDKKRIPFLSDETKITPQTLNFTISEEEAKQPAILSFIFIVTDPKITKNCTVALGDIEFLNCGFNACS